MDDLVLRPLTSADLPEVLKLHRHSESFDAVPRVLELAELQEELDDEQVRLATDTRLAVLDGNLAGYAYTYYLPSEEREERCYVFGQVDPRYRRHGVGTALLEWALERAGEQLRSSGRDLPTFIRAEAFDFQDTARRLYESVGMQPIRYMDELLRPITGPLPINDVPGASVAPWPDGRDEEIRRAKNFAFTDHWGSTPTSTEYWQQMVHGYGSRPDLSFIAVDDDNRVIAHCLNNRYPADDNLLGRRAGWIGNLGTLREWRGRGVASALIAHSLNAFAAADLTHASIGVDSASPTGAAKLYRALGFELEHRSITYQIELTPDTSTQPPTS